MSIYTTTTRDILDAAAVSAAGEDSLVEIRRWICCAFRVLRAAAAEMTTAVRATAAPKEEEEEDLICRWIECSMNNH